MVLDLGKTNIKFFIFDCFGSIVWETRTKTKMILDNGFLVLDHEFVWQWTNRTCASVAKQYSTKRLIMCTFGAAYALVRGKSLVYPMLDYEIPVPHQIREQYSSLRPDFSETFSPNLPGGLNIGTHLFWQHTIDNQRFMDSDWILTLPQYFGWRWTGLAVSEISYLGCHSDLWSLRDNKLSSIVYKLNWEKKIPPLTEAGKLIGEFQLPDRDQRLIIHNGVHDSNANLYFYKSLGYENFTLVSTGTWIIAMNTETPLHVLNENQDMLANLTVDGRSVATARFMGGREFDILCDDLQATSITLEDIQNICQTEIFLLPSFAPGGPFPDKKGKWFGVKPRSECEQKACAILYLVCMTTFVVNSLKVSNQIILDGGFASNKLFAGLFAGVNSDRTIIINEYAFGTAAGAACLLFDKTNGHNFSDPCIPVDALCESSMKRYYGKWLSAVVGL